MVVFMNEFDGILFVGERWDVELDCIFLDKVMDGVGKYQYIYMYMYF